MEGDGCMSGGGRTLVIRPSSLGDVVLAGAVTGGLGEVVFYTHARYRELALRLPGVVGVISPGDPMPAGLSQVVDLAGSLRSRAVGRGLPRRTVARWDLRRRLRVWLKVGAPPPRVVDRYAAAAGVPVAPLPWIDVKGPRDTILLCPGAAWATKRWPAERWAALAQGLPGPLLLLGGEAERPLLEALGRSIGPRAEVVAEAGFQATFAALGRGRLAVAGDTGLLHLCAAAGMPVVGLFGPTTSADGFWAYPGVALERALPCRPCSRFGGEVCPIGDHACLAGLEVEAVQRAVEGLLSPD